MKPFEDFSAETPREVAGASSSTSSTAAVPFWGDSPASWESVVVGGYRLPGVCTLEGKVRRRHDKKHTAGSNGATLTYIGDDQADFTVTVKLWTPEHLETYAKLIDFLRSMVVSSTEAAKLTTTQAERLIDKRQKNQRPYSKFPIAPIDVVHPVLTLHRIKAAHVLEYGFPKAKGEPAAGIYEATIHFLEYVPGAKGAVTTPKEALDLAKRYGPGALGKKVKPSTTNGGPT